MGLLLCILGWLVVALVSLVLLVGAFSTVHFGYWRKRGVPFEKPVPIFGNIMPMVRMRESAADGMQRLYEAFPGAPFAGIWQGRAPTLLVRSPELARLVLAKDFWSFSSRGLPHDPRRDPLGAHLMSLDGELWRRLRARLAPAFGSSRVREMLPAVEDCADRLVDVLPQGDVEMRDMAGRYSTLVIAACVFGMDADCLTDDDRSEFRRMAKKAFSPSRRMALMRLLRNLLPRWMFPLLQVRTIPDDVVRYFRYQVTAAIQEREHNPSAGKKDFLQRLVDLRQERSELEFDNELDRYRRMSVSEDCEEEPLGHWNLNSYNIFTCQDPNLFNVKDCTKNYHNKLPIFQKNNQPNSLEELSDDLLAAQAFVFLLAGLETSAATISFCLYELARNPDIQHTVRVEILNTLEKHEHKMNYQALMDMSYLDCVIQETLRLYPPAANLIRVVTRKYTIPDSSVTLDPGVRVLVPVFAIQRDPQYFPDPLKFQPDRFCDNERRLRKPYTYLPFGEGPRICIGMRFAQLQVKLGLAKLLANFKFEVCEKTPNPIKINPRTMVTSALGGTYLKVSKLSSKVLD